MTNLGDSFSGKRVLVTGHTGFKGAWLSLWLSKLGAHVSGLALPPPERPNLFEATRLASSLDHGLGDIRDLDVLIARLAATQPKMIFHLAAQALVRPSYDSPQDTFATNFMGTVNLLEAVRLWGEPCSIVIVTTDKVYENRELSYAYRETDRLGGHDPYSASKAAAEIAVSSYRASFFGDGRVALATARAGNVIGGGDWAKDRLLPDVIRALLVGAPGQIRNPHSIRPWQHVLDPLAGYMTLMSKLDSGETQACDAFNFGPALSNCRTVAEIAEMAARAWHQNARIDIVPAADAPHEAGQLMLANEKAAHVIGWRPVWDVETAIRATIDWSVAFDKGKDARALCLEQIDRYERDASE